MVYILEMNTEQAALLVKLLTNKAKEIHAWQVAVFSNLREYEYHEVVDLLKLIHTTKEG